MKIAIEISWAHKKGGARSYIKNLLRHIGLQDKENEYFVISNSPIEELSEFRQLVFPCPFAPLQVIWDHLILPFFILPAVLRREKPDLVHFTNNIVPWMITGRSVVTLHDLLPFSARRFIGHFHGLYLRTIIRTFSKHCDHIITDSKYSRRDIMETLRVEPDRITTIYLGLDPEFLAERSATQIAEVRTKYGLPEKFVLSVGSMNLKKNLVHMAQAFATLCDVPELREHGFVVLGGLSWGGEQIVRKIRRLVPADRLFVLHGVQNQDLSAIYSGAEALAYCSFFEGFGLPVIEAMASGLPVITSNTSSLSEIAGDAALLVDPSSVDQIREAMQQILTDHSLREKLVARGKDKVKEFDWHKAAKSTLEVYAQAGSR